MRRLDSPRATSSLPEIAVTVRVDPSSVVHTLEQSKGWARSPEQARDRGDNQQLHAKGAQQWSQHLRVLECQTLREAKVLLDVLDPIPPLLQAGELRSRANGVVQVAEPIDQAMLARGAPDPHSSARHTIH